MLVLIVHERVDTQRQTNGNVITVDGQKLMLDNSIEKDQIAYSAPDFNGTGNNQP